MAEYKLTFGDRLITYMCHEGYLSFGKPPIQRYEMSLFKSPNGLGVSAGTVSMPFSATGSWEKGSDVTLTAPRSGSYNSNVPAKYAIHGAHTGEIPATWYSTSNRWKVNSTVSAYKITLNPKMTFQGYKATDRYDSFSMTGISLVGSTQSNSQTYSSPGSKGTYTYNYSKSFTSNATGVNYGVSARLAIGAKYGSWAKYIATGTTGTWTATGIAP